MIARAPVNATLNQDDVWNQDAVALKAIAMLGVCVWTAAASHDVPGMKIAPAACSAETMVAAKNRNSVEATRTAHLRASADPPMSVWIRAKRMPIVRAAVSAMWRRDSVLSVRPASVKPIAMKDASAGPNAVAHAALSILIVRWANHVMQNEVYVERAAMRSTPALPDFSAILNKPHASSHPRAVRVNAAHMAGSAMPKRASAVMSLTVFATKIVADNASVMQRMGAVSKVRGVMMSTTAMRAAPVPMGDVSLDAQPGPVRVTWRATKVRTPVEKLECAMETMTVWAAGSA